MPGLDSTQAIRCNCTPGSSPGRAFNSGPGRIETGRITMVNRSAIAALAVAAALVWPAAGARAFDESKYPDFSGQWRRPPGIGIQWDQTKPLGRGQQAPLTPEYQKVFEW